MTDTTSPSSPATDLVPEISRLPEATVTRADARGKAILARHAGDLREAARRRLPRAMFDFLEGGSYDEITLRANRADLDALRIRPRVLGGPMPRSQRARIAGQEASAPFALAPTGFAGLLHPQGEVAAARAAEAFGVPFCLSTFSNGSIEDVAAATDSPFFFQLYMFTERAINEALVQRAADAGCSALVLTVDTAVQGRRNRDLDNGLSIPLRLTPKLIGQMLIRPRWLLGWYRDQPALGNLAMFLPPGSDLGVMAGWAERNFKGALSPSDIEWVRGVWPGKLIIKGVLDPEDARIAADLGADAVLVSNHGGRQLDSVQTAVHAFPAIREAVGDRVELLFDGGIRTGIDVLKALGLGASGCFIGRAFLYGLAGHGGPGVEAALQLLAEELDVGMTLAGVEDVTAIPAGLVG